MGVIYFLLLYLATVNANAPGLNEQNEFTDLKNVQCVPILIDICKDLPYNHTRFPNLVGNEDQAEAELQLSTFAPLFHAHSTFKALKFFLCSVYVPMCTDKVPQAIGPCRPLCESVRRTCEPTLNHFGFPWPPRMNCSLFPLDNNAETMCMVGPSVDDSVSLPPIGVGDNHALAPAISSVAIPDKHHRPAIELQQPQCVNEFTMPQGRAILLPRTQMCALDCGSLPQPYTNKQRSIATAVALSFAVIAVLMALLCALVIVCRQHSFTVRYPEACLLFLTLSVAIYSAAYLVAMLYRNSVACVNLEHLNVRIYVGAGEQHVPCTVTAVVLYYFSTAARMWWLNLCWGWFMTAGLGWSPDLLYLRRFPFHVAAWGIPLVVVIVILTVKAVDADPLTAICFVGQQNSSNLLVFLAVREVLVLIAGGLALLLGIFTIRDSGNHDKRSPSLVNNSAAFNRNLSPTLHPHQQHQPIGSAFNPPTSEGTNTRTGLICSLYLVIVTILIVCYFVQLQQQRTFNVLIVQLVADWCYALVAQAWCVAWMFFASLRASRIPSSSVKLTNQNVRLTQVPLTQPQPYTPYFAPNSSSLQRQQLYDDVSLLHAPANSFYSRYEPR